MCVIRFAHVHLLLTHKYAVPTKACSYLQRCVSQLLYSLHTTRDRDRDSAPSVARRTVTEDENSGFNRGQNGQKENWFGHQSASTCWRPNTVVLTPSCSEPKTARKPTQYYIHCHQTDLGQLWNHFHQMTEESLMVAFLED